MRAADASRAPQDPRVTSHPRPSVGRIVLYTDAYNGPALAGIVTAVNLDGTVDLAVFYPQTIERLRYIEYVDADAGTEDARGRWTWPRRLFG